MHLVRKHQRALWLLAACLLIAFAAAFIVLLGSGGLLAGAWLVPESRRAAVLGLAALVLVFIAYGLAQQRRLSGLEDDLRQTELRERTMRARFEELEALFEAGPELGRDPGGTALEIAAQRLRLSLDADACAIYLVETSDGPLSPRAVSAGQDAASEPHGVARGEGMTGRVHATGESLVVEAGPLLGQLAVEMNLARTPGTALCVPVRAGDQSFGVISAIRFDPGRPFVEDHARRLESFASILARVIDPRSGSQTPRAA